MYEYFNTNTIKTITIMKKITALVMTAMLGLSAFAQQALWGGAQIVSPQVNPDQTVTFRFSGKKAKSVKVMADFIPGNIADMKEGKDGVWEYTTAPLEPNYYCYNFVIDGNKTVDPANVYINRDVATITNCFIVSKEKGDQGDYYSVNNVPHGTVRKMWYHSNVLNMDRRITVYTPAGYESSNEKYPVFYLLHGAGGDEEAWYTQGRVTQQLDNLIAEGKAKPMILVMTNGNAWESAAKGESAEGYVQPDMRAKHDNVLEGGFELHFPEVIKFIEKNFRCKTDKKNRAIAGLSMGSFHSENISKYYPTKFHYVGLFSGASVGDGRRGEGASTCPVYMNFDKQMAAQFSKANCPALYFIACGKTDFVMKGVTDLRAYLDAHNYPYEYRETEGGHIWNNWRIYFTEFSQKIFK